MSACASSRGARPPAASHSRTKTGNAWAKKPLSCATATTMAGSRCSRRRSAAAPACSEGELTMKLKLHAFPLSPRSFKVLLVANHLGLDYEFVFCDLRKGAQKDPAYAAINLNQKAPTLEDGD